jgi:two-component sensor histidine kinase
MSAYVPPSSSTPPVVEPSPEPDRAEVTDSALMFRIRQQEILAELGVVALQRIELADLLDRTVELAAKGLEADLAKILQYLPQENRLLLRAGVGWDPGLIGTAAVGADLASPSGFAIRTGQPVISNHLENEERFRTPELLKVYGVRRAINVILQGEGAPFGVLEVDSRSEGEFTKHDIAFLQGAANIIGMAIERQRHERSLQQALDHQKVLLGEISHRVKNSLQLVSSMFMLQAEATKDETLARGLRDAISRMTAVARVHERLYRTDEIGTVDLSAYLGEVCADLSSIVEPSAIRYAAHGPISMSTDRAIRVALLATELVTNAARHAYVGSSGGEIRIALTRGRAHPESVLLCVRDDGVGLPPDFDIARGDGLGMRLVGSLIAQMAATVMIRRLDPGSEFAVELPLHPVAASA